MHQTIVKIAIEIFIALGGVAAATKWALASEEAALKKGLDKLLADPKYRPLLLKWRPQIESALKTLDTVVDSELDNAATQDAQKNNPKT